MIFDSHYYLHGWRPRADSHVYTVGANFFPVPGHYILPFGEGRYQVWS